MTPQELENYRDALQSFLSLCGGKLTPETSQRVIKARDKLKKLTTVQFHDLSIDVHDEMMRREYNRLNADDPNNAKYLPSESNYHPKRNQARQKLASLPSTRFNDLVNDVVFEINNRLNYVNNNNNTSKDRHTATPVALPAPSVKTRNPNDLTINVDKSNNYDKSSDDFSNVITPITPSQREIKPITLVPKKSELTWSSDEEEDDNDDNDKDNHNEESRNNNIIANKQIQLDDDALHRSPSKRYTIATNEVLNEHAPLDLRFPVDTETDYEHEKIQHPNEFDDNDDDDDDNHIDMTINHEEDLYDTNMLKNEVAALTSRIHELELETSNLKSYESKYNQLLSENDELTQKAQDYELMKTELDELKEKYSQQSEEMIALKEIADSNQEKELSVEDSAEYNSLRAYIDKVLESNELLKQEIADLQNKKNNEEIDNLLNKNNILNEKNIELSSSYDELSDNYHALQSKYEKILKSYNELEKKSKNAAIVTGVGAGVAGLAGANGLAINSAKATGSLAKDATSNIVSKAVDPIDNTPMVDNSNLSIVDWQNKFQKLRSNQFETELTSLPKLQNDESLFASNGFISIKSISDIYTSFETLLIYLDSIKDSKNILLVDPKKIDAIVLFEIVANTVSKVNLLSESIKSNDEKIDKIKKILKNSIANLLSTTKYYALYYKILPKLVLNASINDVYFAFCSLVSLVKIKSGSQNDEILSPKMENSTLLNDNATVTETPIAFKSIDTVSNEDDESPIKVQKARSGSIVNVPTTRPLRITQRLASNSISNNNLENPSDINKPPSNINSRTGSPMILNSSILPMIVTSTDNLVNNALGNISNGSIEMRNNNNSNNNNNNINNPTSNLSKAYNNDSVEDKNINNDNIKNMNFDPNDSAISVSSNLVSPEKIDLTNKVTESPEKFYSPEKIETPIKEPFNDSNKVTLSSPIKNIKQTSISSINGLNELSSPNRQNSINNSISHERNSSKVSLTSPVRGKNILDKMKKFDTSIEDLSNNSIDSKNSMNSNKVKVSGDIAKAFDKFGAKRRSVDLTNDNNNDKPTNDENPFIENKSNLEDNKKSSIFNNSVESFNSSIEDYSGRIVENTPFEDPILTTNSNPEETSPVTPISDQNDDTVNAKKVGIQNDNQDEEEEDFNKYGESDITSNIEPQIVSKESSSIEDPLISAGSALDIDEALVRKVSRRASRVINKKKVQSFPSIPGDSDSEMPAQTQAQNQAQAPAPSQTQTPAQVPSPIQAETQTYDEGTDREGWKYDGEEDESEEDEEFDIDKFNTLNPDNTLRELLLYLEHQTVEVIKAIQQTLESIRDPKATKGLLRNGANEINNVVKQMSEGTSTLMNQSRYIESMGHAKYVVGVLEDCVRRMEVLYGTDTSKDNEFAGKNFKQRSAGIAFDVARSTKELVKTVEEASLRDEIAVLDSRLRRE